MHYEKNFIGSGCILMTANAGADQIDLSVSYDGTIYGDLAVVTDDYFPAEGVWGNENPPLPDRWNSCSRRWLSNARTHHHVIVWHGTSGCGRYFQA